MNETGLVVEGLGCPECGRWWRDARVWLCNWGADEVLAVTTDGERQSALTVRFDDRGVRVPKSSGRSTGVCVCVSVVAASEIVGVCVAHDRADGTDRRLRRIGPPACRRADGNLEDCRRRSFEAGRPTR